MNRPNFKKSQIIEGFLCSSTSQKGHEPKKITILKIFLKESTQSFEEYELGRLIKDTRYGNIYIGYLLDKQTYDVNSEQNINKTLYSRHLSSNQLPPQPIAIKVYNKFQINDQINTSSHHPYEELVNIQNISTNSYLIKPLHITEDVTTGNLYYLMDYCHGGDLYEHVIQEGHLTENIAKIYFKQIVLCLQHIHKYGYAHRDITLENILLTEQHTNESKESSLIRNEIRIVDFGSSLKLNKCSRTSPTLAAVNTTTLNSKSTTDTDTEEVYDTKVPLIKQRVYGKYTCMAPEVLWDHSYNAKKEIIFYDPQKADIWSLGVCLFMMLTGFPPFQRKHTVMNIFQTNSHLVMTTSRTDYKSYLHKDKTDIGKGDTSRPLSLNMKDIIDMRDHPQSMRKSLRFSKDTQATRSAPTTPVVDAAVRRNSQGTLILNDALIKAALADDNNDETPSLSHGVTSINKDITKNINNISSSVTPPTPPVCVSTALAALLNLDDDNEDDHHITKVDEKVSTFSLTAPERPRYIRAFSDEDITTAQSNKQIINSHTCVAMTDVGNSNVATTNNSPLPVSVPPLSKVQKHIKYELLDRHTNLDHYMSDEAIDILCKILRHNPDDRIHIEEILNHPWLAQQQL